MTINSVTLDPTTGVFVLGATVSYTMLTVTTDSSGYVTDMAATGLPAGVTFDPYAGDQPLGGTTTEAGDGIATITVTESDGGSLAVEWPWVVLAPLTAPADLSATPMPAALGVAWEPVPGAESYRVQWRAVGGAWLERTTLGAVVIHDLEPVPYETRVRAETAGMDPSPWSDIVTAEPAPEDDDGGGGGGDPADPAPAVPADLAAVVDSLAPVLAAYLGRPDRPATLATARAQLPVVIEFVRGYTRGREWLGYVPPYPLRSVIVSATARLVANPEQVRQYGIADYSETPAVLNGYTLAELGTLRRYRRTHA